MTYGFQPKWFFSFACNKYRLIFWSKSFGSLLWKNIKCVQRGFFPTNYFKKKPGDFWGQKDKLINNVAATEEGMTNCPQPKACEA